MVIESILYAWPTLTEYFEDLSQKNELPNLYISVLNIQNNKINNSIEIYLNFVQHFSSIFQLTILKLESNSTTILDLYIILSDFIE